MMLLSYSWEILVNLMEAILFFYLLLKNNSCTPKSKQHLVGGFLLRIILISVVNFTPFLSTFTLIISLLYDLLFVSLCFHGNYSKKLILGSTYVLVGIAADKITFSIASVFTSYNLSELSVPGVVRFQMTLVYLLICIILIFSLSRKRQNNNLLLSPVIQFIMLVFILLAIIISDQLLGMTIDISNQTIPENALLLLALSGFFILFLIFSFVFLVEKLGYLSKKNLEFMQIQEQEKAERQHYELTEQYIQTLRYWKHDYQNHLAVISKLNNTKNYEKLSLYVNQLTTETTKTLSLVSSGNSIVDAVVSAKLLLASKQNITFTYQIYLLEEELPLSDIQFASILSNLLDNAIEACIRIKNTGSTYITLEIKPHQQMFYLKIKNSSDGHYQYDVKGNFKTLKTSTEHGLGLKRTMQTITKAGGFIHFEPLDTSFTATVLLPLSPNENSERKKEKYENKCGNCRG